MITSKEYELLKNYSAKGYCWIARDGDDGCVYVYKSRPIKRCVSWGTEHGCYQWFVNDDSLPFIKWEDEEPTKIDDLICDYESHKKIVGEKVKVTVPQYVADWIENEKQIEDGLSTFDAYDDLKQSIAFKIANEEKTERLSRVLNWVHRYSDTFIDAWRDGYVVEKEKLYTVELPNHQRLAKIGDTIKFCDEQEWFVKDLKTKLTQSEIESVDPILMKFAKEVKQ